MEALIFFLFVFSSSVYSSTQLQAKIYFIDELPGKETLLFLHNGEVLRIDHQTLYSPGSTYKFIHQNGHILDSQRVENDESLKYVEVNENFDPTILDMQSAIDLFNNMESIHLESQCFNRATRWTYQWHSKQQINSYKSWIFFSRKYIREYQFKWWFHVAPSLDVLENGLVKEKIMDRKYSSGPLDPRAWTNIFMKDKASCRRIVNYNDYSYYPESASCYILRSNMYYHQPLDIELFNQFGISKNYFDLEEVEAAISDTET